MTDLDATPAACRLRPAATEDAAAIAAIYNQTVAAGDASMDEAPRPAAWFARRLAALGEREGFWVLEVDGELRGWCSLLCYSDRAGYRYTAESTVYLSREHRRRGYGKLLGEALLARARELDYRHLVAKVMADNAGSLAYHASLGYELVGRQREVGFRDGRWVDVCILERLLA